MSPLDPSTHLLGCGALICLITVTPVHGYCTDPAAIPDGLTIVDTPQGNYSENDVITYACDEANDGYFGDAFIRCELDPDTDVYSWSDLSRGCKDAIGLDGGAISGICIAATNIGVAVIFIIYTKVFFNPKAEEGGD